MISMKTSMEIIIANVLFYSNVKQYKIYRNMLFIKLICLIVWQGKPKLLIQDVQNAMKGLRSPVL